VKRFLAPLLLALAVLPGCGLGSNDAGGRDDADDRTATMQCLSDAGVIGDGANAPHVKFFLTAGEAEAEQFQGHGEGAEQIGGTLLYVGDGTDDELQPVEKCLADL
jgi:hypothetical protein